MYVAGLEIDFQYLSIKVVKIFWKMIMTIIMLKWNEIEY